ncbi:DEAD/DEAH box helicase [Sutterella megalosphaeroides]|uniref:DNA2/NAM7 helicase-like C-terminal domain-containing protein n=1 Tax=Sutterella megalosphaeroides TaxID=2494234 RepID=A0A2Z6I9I9_9BURK|nr:AAA domain-containing protein [Sutterella megalosphaeroides]BBF23161.1 hypothetical protein SUTMEG_10520 [Sutterella megalosphaeroides]
MTPDKPASGNASDVPPWVAVEGEEGFGPLEIPPSTPQTGGLFSAADLDGPKTTKPNKLSKPSASRPSPDPLVASLDVHDIDDPLEDAVWAVYAPLVASRPSALRPHASSDTSSRTSAHTSSHTSTRTSKRPASGVRYDPAEHAAVDEHAPWMESPPQAGAAAEAAVAAVPASAARAPSATEAKAPAAKHTQHTEVPVKTHVRSPAPTHEKTHENAPEKVHAHARAAVPGTDPKAKPQAQPPQPTQSQTVPYEDPTEAPSKVFAKKPDSDPAHASSANPMPSSPRLGGGVPPADPTEAAPRPLTKEEEHRAEVLRFWSALELFSPPGFSEISTERSALCRWRPGASDVRSLEARAFWESELWPEGAVQIDTKALPREEVRAAVPYFRVYLGIVPLRTLFSHVLRVLEVPLGSSRPAEDALYQPGAARRGVLAENPGLEPVLAEASNIRGTAFLACFELNPWGKLVPGSFRLSDIVSALSLAVRKKRGAAELRRRGERIPKDFFAVPFTIEDAALRNGFYTEHFSEYARKTLGTDASHPGYKRTLDRDGVVTIEDPQGDAKRASADFVEYVSTRIASWIGWGEVFDCAVRVSKHDARWEPSSEDGECLGSFYLGDLRRLLRLAEAGESLGKPLETLLGRASRPEERHDILREPAAVKAALNPERFPLGRWPSDASHHLYAAQQAAVNIVCAPLGRGTEFGKKVNGEGDAATLSASAAAPLSTSSSTPSTSSMPVSDKACPPILSLNGPPGTGKSWLLRDVVADIVVARAETLSGLEHSSDVFDSTRSVTIETNGETLDIRPVRSDLTAPFTIVVASNNNAAIRNITDTLPRSFSLSRRKVDPRTGRETKSAPFGYWRDTALKMLRGLEFLTGGNAPSGSRTARAGVDPTSAAAGALEKSVWGLVSATLGRRANCRRFAFDVLTTAKPAPEAAASEGRDPMRPSNPSAANGTDAAPSSAEHDASLPAQLREEARYLNFTDTSPEENWIRARDQFLAIRERVVKRIERYAGSSMKPSLFTRSFEEDPSQHKTSLWVDEAFERDRSELFLAALSLHAALLVAQAEAFANNFEMAGRWLKSGQTQFRSGSAIDLFRLLSLAVPVVSTTLASAERLFSGVRREEIGWLFVDEASQATAGAAAGLLARSKRAVVLGDPRQLMPVVTMPEPLVEYLRERLARSRAVEPFWGPLRSSLQSLVDRTMTVGAAIRDAETQDEVWTGLPLRTHRRCGSPMFEISNAVSYANQMVQMTPRTDDGRPQLSRWIDVVPRTVPGAKHAQASAAGARASGSDAGDASATHETGFVAKRDPKIVGEELEWMSRELRALESDRRFRHASVFVLSPFRSVADAAASIVRSLRLRSIVVRADTVHAFQGQEADIVVLVLGSAPGEAGKRQRRWAASPVNLINVAVTRARRDLVVIGNYEEWTAEPVFRLVSEHLERETTEPVEVTVFDKSSRKAQEEVREADLFDAYADMNAPLPEPDLPPAPPIEFESDPESAPDFGPDDVPPEHSESG